LRRLAPVDCHRFTPACETLRGHASERSLRLEGGFMRYGVADVLH
jgi:hypothetical protein